MTDIVLNNIKSGYNLSKINDNFEKLENVINEQMLHLTGGNNTMKQSLDMNSNRILNLPKPVSPTEPVRLIDLQDYLNGGDLNTGINSIYIPFRVGENTLEAATYNKELLDLYIPIAVEAETPWLIAPQGSIWIKGKTYFPDGINLSGSGMEGTKFYAYDSGDINDYSHTWGDGVTTFGMFIFGTSEYTELPAIENTKEGSRFIPFSGQVDNLLENGDVFVVEDTSDYSWGNFRLVLNGNGSRNYALSTNNDDRPYYHAGEIAIVRTVTAPDASALSVPNAVFVKGTTWANYTAGANMLARKLGMHTNHIKDCSVYGLPNQIASPIVFRQVRKGTLYSVYLEGGRHNFYQINCVECHGYIVTNQQELTSTSIAYGISYQGCLNCTYTTISFATRHAVTHTSSFGYTVPSRGCLTRGLFKSYRSYAVDFHGSSEECVVEGISDGGTVYSGKNNVISNLINITNYDGIGVFISEIPTWEQTLEQINIRGKSNQLLNKYGFINAGGTGLRGFCPNVLEDGTFRIGRINIDFANPVTGFCELPNGGVGVDAVACANAGGRFDPVSNTCVLNDTTPFELMSEATCSAAGGTFLNNYNVINITARNIHKELTVDIGEVYAVNRGEFTQSAVLCRTVFESVPYQGTTPINVKRLKIDNLRTVNCGGVITRRVDEIHIGKADVEGGVKGLDLQNFQEVKLGTVSVNGVDEQGVDFENGSVQGSVSIKYLDVKNCGSSLTGGGQSDKATFFKKISDVRILSGSVRSITIEPLGEANNGLVNFGEDLLLYLDGEQIDYRSLSVIASPKESNQGWIGYKALTAPSTLYQGRYLITDDSTHTIADLDKLNEGDSIELLVPQGFNPVINTSGSDEFKMGTSVDDTLTVDPQATTIILMTKGSGYLNVSGFGVINRHGY